MHTYQGNISDENSQRRTNNTHARGHTRPLQSFQHSSMGDSGLCKHLPRGCSKISDDRQRHMTRSSFSLRFLSPLFLSLSTAYTELRSPYLQRPEISCHVRWGSHKNLCKIRYFETCVIPFHRAERSRSSTLPDIVAVHSLYYESCTIDRLALMLRTAILHWYSQSRRETVPMTQR